MEFELETETNDQFLDRLERKRLRIQGYDFSALDRETYKEADRLKSLQKAISLL